MRRVIATGLLIFAAVSTAAFVLLWVAPDTSPALAGLSELVLWLVPIVVGTSLALFNGVLSLYDKAHSAIDGAEGAGLVLPEEVLTQAMDQTASLQAKLIGSAYVVVAIGASFALMGATTLIPRELFPWPSVVATWIPYTLALSAQAGLAGLIVAVSIDQFLAIPSFISLYRFLSFELPRSLKKKAAQEVDQNSPSTAPSLAGKVDQFVKWLTGDSAH